MSVQISVWFEKPSVQDNAGEDFIKMNISQPLMNFTTLALKGPNLFFSYCSWCSQGKKTEVVCHSLLQWTTFCQNSPP